MGRKERDNYYRHHRKDKREQQFYNSKEWKKVREVRWQMDNGLCQECIKYNKITLADAVHHIVELKEDWSKRLDIDNLMCVCDRCHNNIHNRKHEAVREGLMFDSEGNLVRSE